MDLIIGDFYISEYGICQYTGVLEEKNLFKFKDLDWYLPFGSEKRVIVTEFKDMTKYMTNKEMDRWVIKKMGAA